MRFIAGGTTLLDLMKLNVETPARLLDINRLPLDRRGHSLWRAGSAPRCANRARLPPHVRATIPRSPRRFLPERRHHRNMATTAGNILQEVVRRFPQHGDAWGQTRARNGLPGRPRRQPNARLLVRATRALRPTRPTCVSHSPRWKRVHVQGPKGA